MSSLAPLLEAFFTERLLAQRHASPHTIAAYRDTFRLLLRYAQHTTGTPPCELNLTDLDAPLIGAFLAHLETERGASVRTRNARLTAVRSLFRFAAFRHPEHAGLIQRVLAIPPKRFDRAMVTFLTEPEIDALLASPDRTTRIGRRDHALLVVAVQTGLRVSELTALTCADVELRTGAHLRCHGKGRKDRVTPLGAQARAVLRSWLRERGGLPTDALFPGPRNGPLSRDAVRRLLARHVATATSACSSLTSKPISPHVPREARGSDEFAWVTSHVFRKTCATILDESELSARQIADQLGHAKVSMTQDNYLGRRLTDRRTAEALDVAVGRLERPQNHG